MSDCNLRCSLSVQRHIAANQRHFAANQRHFTANQRHFLGVSAALFESPWRHLTACLIPKLLQRLRVHDFPAGVLAVTLFQPLLVCQQPRAVRGAHLVVDVVAQQSRMVFEACDTSFEVRLFVL